MTNEIKKEAPVKGRTASGRSRSPPGRGKEGDPGRLPGTEKGRGGASARWRAPVRAKKKRKKRLRAGPVGGGSSLLPALWDGPGVAARRENSGAGDAGASDYAGGAQRKSAEKHHHV